MASRALHLIENQSRLKQTNVAECNQFQHFHSMRSIRSDKVVNLVRCILFFQLCFVYLYVHV